MKALSPAPSAAEKPRGLLGFWALIVTQFQGAFNDNLFRYLIVYFLIGILATDPDTGLADESATSRINSIAGMLFSLPFILFPGIFGALSDRFSKQRVTVWAKYLEILIMFFGAIAFYLGAPPLLWLLLFCMLTQSAMFSPSKYGILPEILPESQLSWGNGVLHMWTMVAIIAGTGLAGPLYWVLEHGAAGMLSAGAVLVALSCLGTGTAHFITKPAPANPTQRIPLQPWAGTGRIFKMFWADRWLLMTVVGYTFFWFAGMLFQQNVVTFGRATLGLSETATSLVLACLALGIGLGSLTAGYLSRGKIEVGLVPIGALGIAAFSTWLAVPGLPYRMVFLPLLGLGLSAGFFYVPLAAALQHRSPKEAKGGVIATANILTAAGMFVASWLYFLLGTLGVGTRQVFLLGAVLALGVGLFICIKLPIFVLRSALWLLFNTLYRLRVPGRENLPEKGGALLVANYNSFLDALAMLASIDRQIVFIMSEHYYNARRFRVLARLMGVIRLQDGPLADALRPAAEAAAKGYLVCVFGEDRHPLTAILDAFKESWARDHAGAEAVPIIPVHLDPIWTTVLGYSDGRFFLRAPTYLRRNITVGYGPTMANTSSAFAIRHEIRAVGTAAHDARKLRPDLVQRAFVKAARRHLRFMAIADARTGKLSYLKTLTGSIVLARKLKVLLGEQRMVSVLVPPSVGGALSNIALQLMGRIPVNLNYTASSQTMASCARQCHATHCVTARAFLERLPLEVPGEAVYLEDIMKSVTKKDRIVGLLLALFCPVRLLERLLGAPAGQTGDDLATIIFSSGSEGEPKGVMLSHNNLLKNIFSAVSIYAHKSTDVVMGFLPFFHSFGFTGTLWLPMVLGVGVAYHPNPLEPRAVGKLVHKYKARFLFGTPTFLMNFTRRCTREELATLDYTLCGAERLAERLRAQFIEKFGLDPLEGYGATECGPIISLSIPNFRVPGFYQKGNEHGKVGRPLAGISVRVVDPDTEEPIEDDAPGLMQIKGPNIMQGYLGMPEKTASVLKDGWYSTGDIVSLDAEGFIRITDRLARFSKIAGEMVPHAKVEDTLHEVLGLTEQSLAVAGVPDPNKGERLVVLHTLTDEQLAQLLAQMDRTGLPNLWRPRPNAFHRIDAIPILGTGKMDLKAVKALARQLDSGE